MGNLSSTTAHNFSKLSLLEPCNIEHKLDIIYLSKTFVGSSILPNDEGLYMKGYKLVRTGIPSYSKKGKEFLAVPSVEAKNLNERLIFEVPIKNIRGHVVSL